MKLREGYTRHDFRADLLAALVVGVVALPLSMALAIAAGLPPQPGSTPRSSRASRARCSAARGFKSPGRPPRSS